MIIELRNNKYVFKKGEQHHLDSVYNIIGLFPNDSGHPFYHQDDIGDLEHHGSTKSRDGSDNDCGEYIKILRDFTIKIKVTTK